MSANSEHTGQASGGYEKRDVNLRNLSIITVIIVVTIVAISVGLYDYFTGVKEELLYETQMKPQSIELRELRAREAEALGSYAVIDSSAGQYQIPIERAIELVADEAFRDSIESVRERGR